MVIPVDRATTHSEGVGVGCWNVFAEPVAGGRGGGGVTVLFTPQRQGSYRQALGKRPRIRMSVLRASFPSTQRVIRHFYGANPPVRIPALNNMLISAAIYFEVGQKI